MLLPHLPCQRTRRTSASAETGGPLAAHVQFRISGGPKLISVAGRGLDRVPSSSLRSSPWTKRESSKNIVNVVEVYLDCDRDSIISLGTPDGSSCHTGAYSSTSAADFERRNSQALTTLYVLEATTAQRKVEVSAKPSLTMKLIGNPELLWFKIREQAVEFCRTIEDNEGRKRTISEMADLLCHSMVLLTAQEVNIQEVLEVLGGRFSKSGIEEKTNLSTKS